MDAFDAALAELAAAMAEAGLDLYDQRAAILRPSLTPDGLGGTVASESVVATGVPCLVEGFGFTREEREHGAREAAVKLWAVSMPLAAVAALALSPRDALLVGGKRYEIQNTSAGEGHAVELIATCVRIDPQAGEAPASPPGYLLLESGELIELEASNE